ncbi:hypothetical protein C8A01DRAFT_36299 [Parachaetomium inaequale]|uniref:Uncharacterized protein n=1 Tax=Parachaetomium inaequale TaxID=2588326 RepID=A0AAN6PIA2_9PEZI|nr:hypothetical protein C8A01DRAFT_36299 [Parachaetomium inaequale]
MSCNSCALGKRARSTSVDDAAAAAETSRCGEESQLSAAGAETPETSLARAGGFKRAKMAHPAAPAPAAAAQPFVPGTWTGGWAQFAPRRESVAPGRVFVAPYGAPAPAAGGMWGAAGLWEEPTPEPSARGTPTPAGEGEEPPARPAHQIAAAGPEVDSWGAPVAAPTVPTTTSPRHSVAGTRARRPPSPICPNWDTSEDEDDDEGKYPSRARARARVDPSLLAALHDDLYPEGVVATSHELPPVACDHPPPYDECIATLPPGSGPDVAVHDRTTAFCARTKERHFGMLSAYDLGAAMAAPPRNRERSWSERSDVSPLSKRPEEPEEKEEDAGGGEKDMYGLSPGIVNWRQQSPWDYARYARELELSDAGENDDQKKEAEDDGGEESEEKYVPWVSPSPWPDYSHELQEDYEEGVVPWEVLSPYEYKIWHDLGESGEGGVGPSTLTPEEKNTEEKEESDEEWFPYQLPSPWPGYSDELESVEGSEGVALFWMSPAGVGGCRDNF